jgi:hypothetical protein
LILLGGVDGEVADERAGGGVDDSLVVVVDEHENAGSGAAAANAAVKRLAEMPQSTFQKPFLSRLASDAVAITVATRPVIGIALRNVVPSVLVRLSAVLVLTGGRRWGNPYSNHSDCGTSNENADEHSSP